MVASGRCAMLICRSWKLRPPASEICCWCTSFLVFHSQPGCVKTPAKGTTSMQPTCAQTSGIHRVLLQRDNISATLLAFATFFQNDVEKVVLVILDKEHHPVERFVFEIMQPPLLAISSDSLLNHVEQLLRAFILKISVCDAVLDNNPPGCTFTILVHTREAAMRNMEKIQVIKDFPWILADEQDVHMHDPRLIPLKTMTSDLLKMQLYVEERAQKGT
uniref:Mitotic spindle assembly checkpoint protein MAD2B n=1 Tax=Laticauda laticaudata TaxID=8630 RepID=A0A8C5WPX8_LATLA